MSGLKFWKIVGVLSEYVIVMKAFALSKTFPFISHLYNKNLDIFTSQNKIC